MKASLLALLVFASLALSAKEPGLADYCGTIHHLEAESTVQVGGDRVYRIFGSTDMPLENLRQEVSEGASYCIRAWLDYDDPNRLILYDFFPY